MDRLRLMLGKNKYKRISQVSSPRVFSYNELSMATDNFRTSRVIGQGKYGNIYAGRMNDTTADQRKKIGIAVKDLSRGLQAIELKMWIEMMEDAGNIQHPNLVKVLGYHACETRLFVVYEYMENKSIQDHLMESFSEKFTWERRLRIAQGAAQGLAFLHNKQIIMRCFKPSEVLLDKEFNAKVSDYMFSMLGPLEIDYCRIWEYESPQLMMSGRLGPGNDVWGFGIFLLELITGRRATEKSKQHGGILRRWYWFLKEFWDINEFKSVLDPSLGDNKQVLESAHALAAVAKMCLTDDIKKQPSMREVLEMINKIVEALELE